MMSIPSASVSIHSIGGMWYACMMHAFVPAAYSALQPCHIQLQRGIGHRRCGSGLEKQNILNASYKTVPIAGKGSASTYVKEIDSEERRKTRVDEHAGLCRNRRKELRKKTWHKSCNRQ